MIQRRKPLKRSTKPIARTPVRKKRPGPPRRGPSEIPADEWRNPGYLAFLREEGRCVICRMAIAAMGRLSLGKALAPFMARPTAGVCDPAHGTVNGRSSKGPDAGAIPLCRAHHDEQHDIGWFHIEDKYGFSREREAAVWFAAYKIWKEAQA